MSVLRLDSDRFCSTSGCITRLCRYNPGPACYIHTPKEDLPRPLMPIPSMIIHALRDSSEVPMRAYRPTRAA